jgi:hypothetical protein
MMTNGLVEAYHRRLKQNIPNPTLHSLLHVIVENQIALGDELPVERTVKRLMAEGLDRHNAIHAIASVIVSTIWEKGHSRNKSDLDEYKEAIEALTAQGWKDSFENPEE